MDRSIIDMSYGGKLIIIPAGTYKEISKNSNNTITISQEEYPGRIIDDNKAAIIVNGECIIIEYKI